LNYSKTHPNYSSLKVATYKNGDLLLIEPKLDHAKTALTWSQDSSVVKYMGGDFEKPTLEKEIKRLREIREDLDSYNWMIEINGNVIGNIHIDSIKETSAKSGVKAGNYGILIGDKKFWRKGIAQHATAEMFKWAFSKGGFEIICSRVLNENIPSINMHKKLGFEYIGKSPYEGKIEGKKMEWQNFRITKKKFEKLNNII
jgi:[ribosomal protein S5]-alanine N-acetyltransferase